MKMKKSLQSGGRAIAALIASVEKKFGKGAVMALGEQGSRMAVKVVPTGSISLDRALGMGGYPRGRLVEIYGPESSGKTTLALHAIAEAQKMGGTCAFIDAEHALDPAYAARVGVTLEELLVSQPDFGEQALDIVLHLVDSNSIDMVVVDSVAALVPLAELEGDMGEQQVGLHARLMSKGMRKITGAAHRTGCTIIFINQTRQKIGTLFGASTTTTGGNALKFYASVRLEVRRTGPVKEGEEVVGNRTLVKVVKNKLAPPFRKAEFEILYGRGVNREGEVLDMGLQAGLVEKKGAWYALGSEQMGQGRTAACRWLSEHPERVAELTGLMKEADPQHQEKGASSHSSSETAHRPPKQKTQAA